MQVSLQYAAEHLADLASAASRGEEVEIALPGQPAIKLVASSPIARTAPKSRRGLVGSGKGQIWMSDDFDSPETNEEIATLFNDGPIFPDEN